MRPLFFIVVIVAFPLLSVAQNSSGDSLAQKIAQRMKDTLGLSEPQRAQIYQINLSLQSQKSQARQLYAGTDSLAVKIQQIENQRDSQYQAILSSEKYQLYRQKKRNLISR